MNWHSAVFLGSALLVFGAAFPVAEEDDHSRLQGTWKVIYSETDGKGFRPTNDVRLSFAKEAVTEWSGGEVATKCTFKIDSAKKPKTMELTVLENRLIPKSKGSKCCWIYAFDGARLKIGIGPFPKQFPKDFTTSENSGYSIDVYERVKP